MSMDHLYPVMLNLTGKSVLVVGGGIVGFRKAEGLLAAGAVITAVSPEWVPEWTTMDGQITRHTRRYESGEVSGYWLVITATNDRVAQQQIFDEGERLGVWVNAADDPDRCRFILPAVHREGPVIVSVSTSGSAPALAGVLRDRAAAAMPMDVTGLAAALRAERDAIHAEGRTTEGLDWRTRITELLTAREVAATSGGETSPNDIRRDAAPFS
jgi:precorrin-2 dehydrogenase / sirohydrochlorin ferrochelatase